MKLGDLIELFRSDTPVILKHIIQCESSSAYLYANTIHGMRSCPQFPYWGRKIDRIYIKNGVLIVIIY